MRRSVLECSSGPLLALDLFGTFDVSQTPSPFKTPTWAASAKDPSARIQAGQRLVSSRLSRRVTPILSYRRPGASPGVRAYLPPTVDFSCGATSTSEPNSSGKPLTEQ
jgi:hypothetical protein